MDKFEILYDDIKEIKDELKEIRKELNSLNAFKFKLMGGAAMFATLTSIALRFIPF